VSPGFRTVPGGAEVLPITIRGFDQGDLLHSPPALDLLFAGDGTANFTEHFEVHKTVDIVTRCKSRQQLAPVLEHSPLKVAGHAGIQGAGCAGHDVDVIGLQSSTLLYDRVNSISSRQDSSSPGAPRNDTLVSFVSGSLFSRRFRLPRGHDNIAPRFRGMSSGEREQVSLPSS